MAYIDREQRLRQLRAREVEIERVISRIPSVEQLTSQLRTNVASLEADVGRVLSGGHPAATLAGFHLHRVADGLHGVRASLQSSLMLARREREALERAR